jgi:hypothetical protein
VTLTIGRVSFADPFNWNMSGDFVSADGIITGASLAVVRALRQQLLGHVNNRDEPVVPVTNTTDSHIDGFYRVLSADVNVAAGGHALFQYPWSVQLQRVSDYAAPLIESRLLASAAIRDHDHSIPNSRAYHALPSAALHRSLGGTQTTLASEEGDMKVAWVATDGIGVTIENLVDGKETYSLVPADWYIGASRVELDYADDGTFRGVIGRQIQNLPGEQRWRLSNGIIRVTLEDASDLILGISRWTGAAWSTATEFYLGGSTPASPWDAPASMAVLRNGPDRVIARFGPVATGATAAHVDLTLTRGMPWIEVKFGSATGNVALNNFDYGAGRTTTSAAAVFTATGTEANLNIAGIKANAADGDGFKWVVATVRTIETTELTEGYIDAEVDTSVDGQPIFMLGLSTDTGTADHPTRPEGNVLQFFAAQSETIRVVER